MTRPAGPRPSWPETLSSRRSASGIMPRMPGLVPSSSWSSTRWKQGRPTRSCADRQSAWPDRARGSRARRSEVASERRDLLQMLLTRSREDLLDGIERLNELELLALGALAIDQR